MTQSIAHRGPDDDAVYVHESVGLGFRRLSILDLSESGKQPMFSGDRRKVIVFNGEIYNYRELKKELQQLGHRFSSSGDTEVLLSAYCEWGVACLEKLNGMWAFLIYDVDRKVVFGARDRLGVKPLYIYKTDGYFFFASEIKAILKSGIYTGGTNWNVASRFLLLNRLDTDRKTFYEDIECLAPGISFTLSLDGNYSELSYWSLDNTTFEGIANPIERFASLFEDSVSLRMRSDVPVGVCLSGGIDSTAIICSMSRFNDASQCLDRAPVAFSYMASEFDESSYIEETIKWTGGKLHRVAINPIVMMNDLGNVIGYHDEPVHSMTALVGFELMKLIHASGIKVVLNGQGADETIGGYPNYFNNYWYSLLSSGKLCRFMGEVSSFCKVHRASTLRSIVDLLAHFVRAQAGKTDFYQRLARRRQLREATSHPWFSRDLGFLLADSEFVRTDPSLESVLKYSVITEPLPLYLRVEDRNSMANSVEVRLPFMDYRLIEFVFSIANHWKIRGPWNKFILREAMEQRVPESVRRRVDKMGFPTPSKDWFATTLREMIHDHLCSVAMKSRGIYDIKQITADYARHCRGELDVSGRLFNVIQFELWCALQKERVPLFPETAITNASVDDNTTDCRLA